MNNKINICLDMETADPDDVLTLCLLATHPDINLRCVSITPGTKSQAAVVRHVLKRLDMNIPIGLFKPDHPKQCVSEFHYKWLGRDLASQIDNGDGLGKDILNEYSRLPNTKIVTGAPLGNVASFVEQYNPMIEEIVVQGGFAGDSVVPPEHRLLKFIGKETCPTFNLNGNIPAAKTIIACNNFKVKQFVSKNVCHGVIYDEVMHERMRVHKNNNPGFSLLFEGMTRYLKDHSRGKAFHDPLAACMAIDASVCNSREVELYREKGEWGSRLKEGTGTFITISCDREKFERVLVGLDA